jgi:hypothetical protein
LGRVFTIEHSDKLHDCESVTPHLRSLNRRSLAIEALLFVCPLYLVSEPKKCHIRLRPPGWWRFGLRQLGGHDCFLVRRRHKFGATWADFDLGLLSLLSFYRSTSGGWDIRGKQIGPLRVL